MDRDTELQSRIDAIRKARGHAMAARSGRANVAVGRVIGIQNGIWVECVGRHYLDDRLEDRRAASGRDLNRIASVELHSTPLPAPKLGGHA